MKDAPTRALVRNEVDRKLDQIVTPGQVWYVNNSSTLPPGAVPGRDADGYGKRANKPFATIDYAITPTAGDTPTANNGDVIFVLPGHVETVTAAITLDVAGLSIIGLGIGTDRPQVDSASNIDRMTITAVNCLVEGLYFNEGTSAAQTSVINIAADYTTIRNCQFDLGAQETDGAITIASGNHVLIEDCGFDITADGPGSGVNIESTSNHLTIRRCHFRSVTSAASFDEGAIFEDGSALHIVVEDCKFVNFLTQVLPIDLTTVIEQPVLRNNSFVSLDVADNYSGPQKFFVNADTGNDVAGAGTSWQNTIATIDFAIGLCSPDNGDEIHVAAGHTETETAMACDIAGIKIIGHGHGAARPTITADTSAADLIDVTAASVWLENLILVGGSSGTTALVDVAAADFTAVDCVFSHGAAPVDAITIAAGGDRFHFKGCLFRGTANGPTAGIIIEVTALKDWIVEDCIFQYGGDGLDIGGIECSKKTEGYLIKNCDFIGMDLTALDMNSSTTARGDGTMANCSVAAFAQTDNIDTLIDAGGTILIENYGSDLPAEAGGLIPVTTPA